MEYSDLIRSGYIGWNGELMPPSDNETVRINEEEISDENSGRTNSLSLDKEVVGSIFTVTIDWSDITDQQFKQIRNIKTTVFGTLDFWYCGEVFSRVMSSSSIQSVKKRVTQNGVSIWDVHLEFSEKEAENRILV